MHSENTKDQNQIKGNLAVEANRESYNHIWTMFAKIRPNKGAKENAIVRNNLQYTRHLACKIRSATLDSFYMNKITEPNLCLFLIALVCSRMLSPTFSHRTDGHSLGKRIALGQFCN